MGQERTALVVGAGPGLGRAVCGAFAVDGYAVAAVSRSGDNAACADRTFRADAADEHAMAEIVATVERDMGPIEALVFNAAQLHIGSLDETSPAQFETVWRAGCLGAFVCARAVLPLMARRERGAAILTGATASQRGGANFAAFASAKFALRGLAQSCARAYGSQGVHVAHAVLDGIIGDGEGQLHPADIARAYMTVLAQPRSAWMQEFDLRPSAEKF